MPGLTELQAAVRDAVRDVLGSVDGRLTDMERRLSALETLSGRTAENLLDVTKIVEQLAHDQKAVLTRRPGRVVLDKDEVYRAAARSGLSRRDLLRGLDAAGILCTDPGPPKRYTKVVKINGRAVRSVVIINFK